MKGREAIKNAFKLFFNQYNMEQHFQLDEIIISGNIAFVRGLEINRLTSLEDSNLTVAPKRAFSVSQKNPMGFGASIGA